jgi:hypothetical protein
MADETKYQVDRYNTEAKMGDVQGTEAERVRVRATELAAHERGTVRDLEPQGAAGGAVGGEEAHQQLGGTTRKGTDSGTKLPE